MRGRSNRRIVPRAARSPFALRNGFRNSHTISPPGVTSKARPLSDSATRVLPLGRRWFDPRLTVKKEPWSGAAYDQTTRPRSRSTSRTRDQPRERPLSKTSSRPSGSIVPS
jgi:hypothetical protein